MSTVNHIHEGRPQRYIGGVKCLFIVLIHAKNIEKIENCSEIKFKKCINWKLLFLNFQKLETQKRLKALQKHKEVIIGKIKV